MALDFSGGGTLIDDAPKKPDFSAGGTPLPDFSAHGTPVSTLKVDPIFNQGVFQPSQFSSGLPQSVPASENPDYGMLKSIAEDKGKQLPSAIIGGAMLPLTAAGKALGAGAEDVGAVIGGNPSGFGNVENLMNPPETPSPFQQTVSDISKTNPTSAVAGKIAAGTIENAPVMVAGLPEGALGRLIALGFTGQMIKSGGDAATILGTELGKNPQDRNEDAVTSAVSDLIQSGVFSGLAGKHALKGVIDATGANGFTTEQIKASESQPSESHTATTNPSELPETAPPSGNSRFSIPQSELDKLNAIEPKTTPEAPTEPLNVPEPQSTIEPSKVALEPPKAQETALSEPTPIPQNIAQQRDALKAIQEAGMSTPEQDAVLKALNEHEEANRQKMREMFKVPEQAVPESKPPISEEAPKAAQIEPEAKTVSEAQKERGGSIGAASPSEFENKPTTPTGIKNATVDQERIKRGLPPAIEPARRSFGKVWDEAMAKVDKDPDEQTRLINELRQKPRAITDTEDALLLQRQIDLQNEYGKTTRELAQAYDDAKEFPNRLADVEELKIRVAHLSDQLLDLYNINKRVGTETGRGLNARKMMAYEDYSLASMETRLRAAKDGKPLTPEEKDKLNEFSKTVEKSQKAIEEYQRRVNPDDNGMLEESKRALDSANKTVRDAAATLAKEESKTRVAKTVNEREVQKIQEENARKAVGAAQKVARDAATKLAEEENKSRVREASKAQDEQAKAAKEALAAASKVVRDEAARLAQEENKARIAKSAQEKELAKVQANAAKKALEAAQKRVRQMAADAAKAETKARIARAEAAKIKEDPRLKTLKTRYSKRFEELIAKMAGNDFEKQPKSPLTLDPEAQKLKSNYERAKLQFDRLVMKERLKNRTMLQKTQDTFVKWRRAFLLSSPVTLAKLTSAAIERGIITPTEEAVGGVMSKVPILNRVSARAPREGGLNVDAEAKALTEGFTKGMQDAWNTLKTGHSDLDSLYGRRDLMPREMIDFIGSIHGALKAPVKRAEYSRSLEKRFAFAIRNGQDVTDPMLQTKIAIEAFKDAQRSIFMQDNKVTAAWHAGMAILESPDKATGKISVGRKSLASAGKVLLPIVKVPTNIVAETLQYAFGSVTGSTRLALALRKGVETLKPEEADLIMRELKKGSLGAALLTLGFLNPQMFGGYYQQNDKKQVGHPKFGTMQIMGFNVPTMLIHNPLLETLQIGATIRHVADSKLKVRDTGNQGVFNGAMAGLLGLTEEVPFIKEPLELDSLFNPYERNQFADRFARDMVVPLGVSWVAKHFDRDANGNYIVRKDETLGQAIQSAIPLLRERLPIDQKKTIESNKP